MKGGQAYFLKPRPIPFQLCWPRVSQLWQLSLSVCCHCCSLRQKKQTETRRDHEKLVWHPPPLSYRRGGNVAINVEINILIYLFIIHSAHLFIYFLCLATAASTCATAAVLTLKTMEVATSQRFTYLDMKVKWPITAQETCLFFQISPFAAVYWGRKPQLTKYSIACSKAAHPLKRHFWALDVFRRLISLWAPAAAITRRVQNIHRTTHTSPKVLCSSFLQIAFECSRGIN